mgnify:CR=1 FL=1
MPFYHNSKDEELLDLLELIKHAVKQEDVREVIKEKFFWAKYLKENKNPKSIFMEEMGEK